jgi:hypothetical protein
MKDYTKEDIEKMRLRMEGETSLDRIKRKCREEPFVPAGIVTVLSSFKLLTRYFTQALL